MAGGIYLVILGSEMLLRTALLIIPSVAYFLRHSSTAQYFTFESVDGFVMPLHSHPLYNLSVNAAWLVLSAALVCVGALLLKGDHPAVGRTVSRICN